MAESRTATTSPSVPRVPTSWLEPTGVLIGGKMVVPDGRFERISTADGRTLGCPDCGRPEAELAVVAARNALNEGRRVTAFDRADALHRWAAAIEAREEELAQLITMEMGKPIRESRSEVASSLQTIRWSAEEAPRAFGETLPSRQHDKHLWTLHQPVGIAYGVTPWNFPVAMVARKAAPAMAAGAPMILKPAEESPFTALALATLWCEVGNAPGMLQVLPTSHPALLTEAVLDGEDVRKLTFTGSTAVGRLLYEQAARRLARVSLELGGNAPFLVFSDADLDAATAALRATKFSNAGQTCISTNRLLVDGRGGEAMLERAVVLAQGLTVGDPFDEATDIGPLVSEEAAAAVRDRLRDAKERGATVLVGGDGDGSFVQPTVLQGVDDGMRAHDEEIFGPLLGVSSFDSVDEAFERANRTPYGLAAYVWTRDIRTAHLAADRLSAGIIGINSVRTVETQAPFGGLKASGVGYEGGRWGVESFLDTKYVSLDFGSGRP
jgi:succinate-semialdehyde dehydrogenase / glutarate-semialdehyde dehydrogenase